MQLVLENHYAFLHFSPTLLPPYMWWLVALGHASSCLWSDFLGNWVCSLLQFFRQKLPQWLTTAAWQPRCPCHQPGATQLLCTDPCANTRERQGGFILSALIVPSPEKLIRFVISLWWLQYLPECFASGRRLTSSRFLLKLHVTTIFPSPVLGISMST